MTGEAPGKLYTIPPGVPFLEALAREILRRHGDDPLSLTRVRVLLPTRRACRALAEAFLIAAEGKALLLPRLLPLGDVDEEDLSQEAELAESLGETASAPETDPLPPVMPELKRQLLLARLVSEWWRREGVTRSAEQAARLAEELARLVDQVETEGLAWDGLKDLVPADYASHWQETLKFLSIVTEAWPAIEAEEGTLGPAERRRLLLERQTAAWAANPPADPVIVAGSTGSIPATAALIAQVLKLPEGMVVLPGLDRGPDKATWKAIAADPGHPQHGLARLLKGLGVSRDAVLDWPGAAAAPDLARRSAFLGLALRPAEAAGDWTQTADLADKALDETALEGLRRIDCASPAEEAGVIALLLRQALETPEQRAALVTPDRGLARRVAAELRRWDIEVDDSAGRPLAETPPGSFLRLTAELLGQELAPLPLLAALKHPLAAGGEAPASFRAKVRALERAVLRGPRPSPGFAGLRAALAQSEEPGAAALRPFVARLEEMAAPFLTAGSERPCRMEALAAGHLAFAEALAAGEVESGAERLWSGEAGEAAAGFATELLAAEASGLPVSARGYPGLLESLMAGRAVRPRFGRHPRLAILGPLEARLASVEVMVLGGLNEGSWPAESDPGPWLSRPMRADFGLPPPERRIGLSAHDFTQACAAPRVFLTRSARVEGAPTVASRWLLRLEALMEARGLKQEGGEAALALRAWAGALDAAETLPPAPQPAPCPPLAARPRRLSVTEVETWIKDPYVLYARRILGLRALDPIDADPGAAERGILIHEALERFSRRYPGAMPARPLEALLAIGAEVFEGLSSQPGIHAIWWPRFERAAAWFLDWEAGRRAAIAETFAEVGGGLQVGTPEAPFELRAKADRIDRLSDGTLAILDYKTGMPPSEKEVEAGFAPQLPLEAAMAAAGAFEGVPALPVATLGFVRLSGGDPAGEFLPLGKDLEALAAEGLEGLRRLIAHYDDETTPYLAAPRLAHLLRFNDYAHLARVKEWGAGAREPSKW